MVCPNCGTENRAEAKFCGGCGQTLARTCPACGTANDPGMRAVALDVQGAQAVGYLVRPGDYVDVLGTIPDDKNLVTRHLLQAKHVLATDQQYRLDDSAFVNRSSYSTVTIEVTPAEAETIEAYRSIVRGAVSISTRRTG